MSVHSTSI